MKKLFLFFIGLFFLSTQLYSSCIHFVELRRIPPLNWNNSSLTIKVNDTAVLTDITLNNADGVHKLFSFQANTGDIIDAYITYGWYPEGIEYTVMDEDSTIIGQSGQGDDLPTDILGMIGNCPTCLAPSLLTTTNITPTSAKLGWTENGDGTTWNIKWGEAGFDFDTEGTTITGATTTPYYLANLDALSTYDWYVQTDCSEGDESVWRGPQTFTTTNTTSPPIFESFETRIKPNGWDIDGCYIGTLFNFPPGESYKLHTPINYSEPIKSFTTQNIGPILTDMSLSFFYALPNDYNLPPDEGSVDYIVSVSIDYGQNYIDLDTVENNFSAGWQYKSYDLSPYVGEYLKIKFTASAPGNASIAFDNISIAMQPSCQLPSILLTNYATTRIADLSWHQAGDVNSWNIKWGETGFNPFTEGTQLTGLTTNSYQLTGLAANTAYDWYVQADCGGGDLSDWAGPKSFTTLKLASTPYFEGFATRSLPDGWRVFTDLEYYWIISEANGITPIDSNYLCLSLHHYSYFDGEIQFIPINIGSVSTDMQLSFNYAFVNDNEPDDYVAGDGYFTIKIFSLHDSTTFSDIVHNNYLNGWQKKHIDLSSFDGKDITIRIGVYQQRDDFYFAFDNLKVADTLQDVENEPEFWACQIWSNDNKVYINIPNSINEKALIQFFDLQGKVVYKGEHYLNNPEIIDVHSNQRILIARIITGNHVYTQKVFIR